MKKFNNFSILRSGKLFLLTLAAWLTMTQSWAQTEPNYLCFTATEDGTQIYMQTPEKGTQNEANQAPNIDLQYRINNGDWIDWTKTTLSNTFYKYYMYENVGKNKGDYELRTIMGIPIGYSYVGTNKGSYIRVEGTSKYYDDYERVTVYYKRTAIVELSANDKLYLRTKSNTPIAFCSGDISFSMAATENVNHNTARISEDKIVGSDGTGTGNYWHFTINNAVECSGNIMSLLDKTCQSKTVPNHAFAGLFYGCTTLLSAPALPATTLGEYCYYATFCRCRSLNVAPELPATTLKNYCYSYMFAGCASLQNIDVKFSSFTPNGVTNPTYNWATSTKRIHIGETQSGSDGWITSYDYFPSGGIFTANNLLDASIQNGESYIPNGWTLSKMNNDYLRFTWDTGHDGPWFQPNIKAKIYLFKSSNIPGGPQIQYSKDAKTWKDLPINSFPSGNPKGAEMGMQEILYLRAKGDGNSTFSTKNCYYYFSITLTEYGRNITNGKYGGILDIGGNIMSLLDPKCLRADVPDYCFYRLFSGRDGNNPLVDMFGAPQLPAVDLGQHCYEEMFKGCKNLTNAPELPATTNDLSESYSLDCYKSMFENCSRLEYIKVGFDKWTITNNENTAELPFTTNWVKGVTSTSGRFICPEKLPHTYVDATKYYADSYIPTEWNNNTSSVGSTEEKEDWLCFETENTTATVQLNRSNESHNTLGEGKLQYSLDNGASWYTYTWSGKKGKIISLSRKNDVDRVYFRTTIEDDKGRCSKDNNNYYQFSFSGNIIASGNIMSLLRKDCNRHSVNDYEFNRLFHMCKTLKTAPSLPATTLGAGCYEKMFRYCTALTTPPSLPAENLADFCYRGMFEFCTSMTYTPNLPAVTLKPHCYNLMFRKCSNITSAPTLPATELKDSCYTNMFYECSELNYINVKFAKWDDLYTKGWVNEVSKTGDFYCPEELLLSLEYGKNRIPYDKDDKWRTHGNTNEYLYFEANRNGSTIQLKKVGTPYQINLLYSTDNGVTWKKYYSDDDTDNVGTIITLNRSGVNRVFFKAGKVDDPATTSNSKFNKDYNSGSLHYYQFKLKGSFNAKGSIMSLLSQDFNQNTVPDYAFCRLFENCTALKTMPNLPATNVGDYAYTYLFSKCQNLEKCTELPATTLGKGCYTGMFRDCYNLKSAPELNATKLANSCYSTMFQNCTALTIAPTLPASELKDYCYSYMFQGCTNLEYLNVGFKKWHSNATSNWVADNGTTYPFHESGIFMCPEELAENQSFGSSNIPKNKDHKWVVNVAALRFTAENGSAWIRLNKIGHPTDITLEYSLENAAPESWKDLVFGTAIDVAKDHNIYIRAKANADTFSSSADDYYQFVMDGSMSVEGKVHTLFNTIGSFTSVPDYTYYKLFSGCKGLKNVPTLTATDVPVGKYSHAYMFENCSAITEVPESLAQTLSVGCYKGMFKGCSSIKAAPALPATELKDNCYQELFSGCTSLATAPELQATELKSNCYNSMFQNCTSLKIAPELPATTLKTGCYSNMFKGCSSLGEISVNFSAWSPDDATTTWVYGVANNGVFSCPNGLNTNTFAASYVPKDNDNHWDVNPDFLTFKAESDDVTISLDSIGKPEVAQLIYSVGNKSNWNDYTWDENGKGLEIALVKNQNVYFKAKNDEIETEDAEHNITLIPNKLSKDADNYYQFSITGSVAASGTASYLLGRTTNNNEVPAYGFYKLFEDCTALTSAPAVSPNAKANAHAYESMFEGCSNITSGPTSLPATTVGTASFKNMFKGCEKLTTSPAALPATSVAESCYESMFEGDSLMTRIPTLGVSTTSAKAAYKNMFKGCKSLTSDNMPSKLMADNNTALSESVYEGMFEGCSSITNANINLLSNNGFGKACYKNMFKGCTNLAVTPTSLLANSLSESCYESMFEGCESITRAPTMPVNQGRAVACYKAMFKGCKSLTDNIPSELGAGWGFQESCFESMFEGCESLTTTPALTNPNVTKACYKAMFKGCTSLTDDNLPAIGVSAWAMSNGESAFESMFEGCTNIVNATIVLPATHWSKYEKSTFKNMFKDCSKLTTPLAIGEGEIFESCFEGMYENCISLTQAPSLGQNQLANKCYYRMFAGCSSLKKAPVLPAKELKDSCYAYMFNGCEKLRFMDVAFSNWKEDHGATFMWVENVAPTGTFMKPFNLNEIRDDSHIPYGWSADDNGNYLCFSYVGKAIVKLQKEGTPSTITLSYSTDKKKTWQSLIGDKITWGQMEFTDTLYVKISDGALSTSTSDYWYFQSDKELSVSGNIMSLLDATMEETAVPDYAFYKLFFGCPNITDISGLELPATEVGAYAYAKMFEGCSMLKANATSTPELPATTLGAYCYQNLFKGWKKLQTAPSLPATTLEEGCYSNMFNDCDSLKVAPILPATQLAERCYESMFANCDTLSSLNVAFTEWLDGATDNWVNGVANDGIFTCPWALANDAIKKHNQNLNQAYGPSWIPKDAGNPWMILLQTGIEFNYRTGDLTFTGQSPITYTTDNTLSIDNRIGETVSQKSVTINLNDWLNESITQFDSITYYALAGTKMGDKVQPTVNSITIYRHPKKIDMCICDTKEEFETAMYYANKVSSANYPVKVLIEDGEYDFGNKSFEVGEYVSVIGESLNGTILKSSSDKGVLNIKGNDAYLQDMKLVNTGSGAAFTNKGQRTTLHVAMEGYYNEGGMTKHYLPESWTRATDPSQATISAASVNGSSISLTSNAKYFLVRVDEKYAFANSTEFHLVESIAGKNVTVRAANNRGAFGEPITPTLITADGLTEYNKVTVKLNGYGFSSFCFDDANVDQLQVIGASVYKGIYREGAVYLVRLNEHDIVPKRTGVILAGLQNSTVSFYENNSVLLSDEESNPYNYLPDEKCIGMSGNWSTDTIVNNGHNYYVLSNTYGGFKPLKKDGGTIKPNKAYFDLGNETNAATVRIVFGMWEEEEEEVVSGINYLPTAGNDSEYSYMLTGVRMKDAKGLVIQNNKVVLIK